MSSENRLSQERPKRLALVRVVRCSNLVSAITTTTTHCPRTTQAKPLRSSKWQGTCSLQLPVYFAPAERLREPLPSPIAPAQWAVLTLFSWIYRENNVPSYQREFQKHDGVRLWMKVRGGLDKSLVA